MKSYNEELWFNTKNRYEFINITDQVEEAVKKSGVKEGLCLVNAMHITACVAYQQSIQKKRGDSRGLLRCFLCQQ